jgi:hypothetical protein
MLKPGRFCGAVWFSASIFLACGSEEGDSSNPSAAGAGADGGGTGGSAGTDSGGSSGATTGGSGTAGQAGTPGSGGDSVGGSDGAGANSGGTSTGGTGTAGATGEFWCDMTDANVCRCRNGAKPNASATNSCPASDCCVRTGSGDNHSCACSKPGSLYTCEDVKNFVGGAIVVPSCPF